jgi:hypothetical protein
MPVTSATRKIAQLVKAVETVAPSQTGWSVPAAREEMLPTSGMSAGASEDAATQDPGTSGSERASEAKRRPAQRPSCEARRCKFVCQQEEAG